MLLNQADGKEQRTAMHEACHVEFSSSTTKIHGPIFDNR